ncbi:LacI family transcriptional regulator [Pseudoflavonifractor sp. 524-17]|uniref:LacI family DNA-binding transcriptional regulator n=1 Tax=Pseudoflavonifractor sp. 524-17 TaxID=2304577 RepID=UPI001379EAEE|nr:LacI family DNA-binding transcriptional regulator [Pseudoflavonifractor sp. 524-17]NCE66148.1 LacI family transcriptional regulator [Pseudoflavonifractor sp. 524-17]
MATLKDVARLACVDVSTVSRALNNTSYVHPDTKERIYAAAKELGYHPNIMAQALRQGKRHTIGVVVPRLHLAIFSEILQGIELGARKLGYATLICNTEDDPTVERDCLNRLRNGFVDGIIIAGTGRNGRLVRDIRASGIAVVQIVRQQEGGISSIVADYEACGYEAVYYLYQKGCREIGLIGGSLHLAPYRGRLEGYRKAVKTLGLRENFQQSNYLMNSFEYGYECMNQLLDNTPGLDGVLAAVDIQGLGAIRALTERGIRIPEQVKVISLTGHAVGGMLETSMTSMEMPAHEMGEKAAEMVIGEIEAPADKKPSPQCVTFATVLVEREST